MKKKNKFQLWFIRAFSVITTKEALELDLTHSWNIHGDQINQVNYRSVWEDENGKLYRVNEYICIK